MLRTPNKLSSNSNLEPKGRSSKAVRSYYTVRPRFRPPPHLVKRDRAISEDYLTTENKEFIEEMIEENRRNAGLSIEHSSLVFKENEKLDENWNARWQRVGVLARKIGNYPLWLSNGRKVATTLLHVQDTHVIRVAQEPVGKKYQGSWVVVGTESVPPNTVTKEYASLFNEAGLLPKRHLRRFYVYPPHLAPPPATPLTAAHFTPGDVIDVAAYTKDRGFQGVMKRWGFSGMGASHGVTKTHRRPGNIGAGGNKARVWPGTKMPGHMGNRWRVARGVLVLRVDPEASVLWALGVAVPGATGTLCSLYDTLLPLRRAKPHSRPLPSPHLHQLDLPSISFEQ